MSGIKTLSVCLLVMSWIVVETTMCSAYPVNYLSEKLGAKVVYTGKLAEGQNAAAILSDAPVSKGGFVFAREETNRVFVVDLGQERTFDRMLFGSGNAGPDPNRDYVRIGISNTGADGPFETVLDQKGIGYLQVLRLPKVTARWVRFEMGPSDGGVLVQSVRIYKGYEHPKLEEVTKLLYERIRPDIDGLEQFYAQAEAGQWSQACSELRKYFASKHVPDGPPDPNYDTTRAQAVADGKMDFAGLARVDTLPIDWSHQPTTDWYEHKNILNRGSVVGLPVDASYHTRDPKWIDLFRSVFYDWTDENPTPEVTAHADYPTWRTLDSALRLGWLVSRFSKVTHIKEFEDELWANYLYSIWEHTDYLRKDDFDGGNWLAMVTSAVMGIALEFPEFKDNKLWLAYGKDAFEKNVLRDVYEDGKEVEDSPGYVCMAYTGMYSTLKALDEAGVDVNPEVRERLSKTLTFIGAVIQPDGFLPDIGDGGGPLGYDMLGPSRYFDREDILYILTAGKEGAKPEKASIHFPNGNWSVMRSEYDPSDWTSARHLVFKSSSGSHGHLDVLSFTAFGYGRALLIDPGIRSYEGADVARYVRTAYHNTICIDDKDQSRGGGKTEKWYSNAGLDYLLATNRPHKEMDHTRDILFVKPDYWVVHDVIIGQGDHKCDQNWHFMEDANPTEDKVSKCVQTTFSEGGNIMLLPVEPAKLDSGSFEFFIARNRMSSDMDEVESRGWRYSQSGPLPQEFDVVLLPYSGPDAPAASVKRLEVESSDLAGVTGLEIKIGDRTDYLLISRTGIKKMDIPQIKLIAEGEIVIMRTRNGTPYQISGANVRSISHCGTNLFSSDTPSPNLDQVVKP